jgi:hypothetical protein
VVSNNHREELHMTEKYLFGDVDLPFHAWVKEGRRWVLRETVQGEPAQARGAEDAERSEARRKPSAA